jgi:hypothetical protein
MQSGSEQQSMSGQESVNDSDQRHINRDSLFVLAAFRIVGRDEPYRVKIRNLSAGGLMAEGDLRVVRGTPVSVEVRNVGWVDGSIAWVADNRFGVAFDTEIDPRAVRAGSAPGAADNGFIPMRPLAARNTATPAQLRKI